MQIQSLSALPSGAPYERPARRLLTTAEICAALPCSPATLYRLRQRGAIQSVKVGFATRWPASILDDALAGRLGAGAEGGR